GMLNHRLPNLRRLMARGVYGPLESTIPPITVPAWMCMMTGKDPGALGIYGFRNRKDNSYDGLAYANSRMVREPAIWDVLAEHGKRSILLGVPLTYPPKPVSGLMISDFLAPDTSVEYTFPPELKREIERTVGDYILDVRNFRTVERARLLADIYVMTERRFQLARHLATEHAWDFMAMVEMGPDRLHHAFWRYFDPEHRAYIPGNEFEAAIPDYYESLDRDIGALIRCLQPDTHVLVVSDHGAGRMDGAICFNDWLSREGYLTLKSLPERPQPLTASMVDWSRTRAWADGGYYGRLFLNVSNREPQGVVPPAQVEALKEELTGKLEALPDDTGRLLGNRVFRPEKVYSRVSSFAPDLIVYFGDLLWRSNGTVGNESIYTHENDTGPDDANHAQHGIFILARAGDLADTGAITSGDLQAAKRDGLSIYDVAPTALRLLGIPAATDMGGHAVSPRVSQPAEQVYSAEEEAELARRLEELGYL
ncbi:MAG TPA: alkaline phosphatase family protein, partial [Chthonomonadales bacterium]|nr:alkaline phosphatase family protein [Chthonomonadales bacterium]